MAKAYEDGETLSSGKFYVTIGALIAIEILSTFETNMIYTALPTIMREFSDPHMTGWLLTAFLLVQAGAAAIGGRLGDLYGRRRVLAVLIGACGIGSFISATAPNLELIIAGRGLQGMSGAILPLCYGITRRAAPAGRAPFWIGIVTGAYAFSAAIGYLVAGYLSDTGSWRSIFWFTLIYAAALLPVLWFVVPEFKTKLTTSKLDVMGGVLFVPAVAAVLYGLTLADKLGWASYVSWSFLLGGAALGAMWFRYESKHPDPLIDVKLLYRPKIALGNVCGVFVFLGVVQMPLPIMMIMQQPVATGVGLGMTATLAAVLKLPSNVASLCGASLSGWISGVFGSRTAVIMGGVSGVIAWVFLIFFHGSFLTIAIGSMIAAFSAAIALAGLPNLLLEDAPVERSSEITGLAAVTRGIAFAIGAQTLMGILATSRASGPNGGAFPTEKAYQLAFGFIAITALITAIVAVLVKAGAQATGTHPAAAKTSRPRGDRPRRLAPREPIKGSDSPT